MIWVKFTIFSPQQNTTNYQPCWWSAITKVLIRRIGFCCYFAYPNDGTCLGPRPIRRSHPGVNRTYPLWRHLKKKTEVYSSAYTWIERTVCGVTVNKTAVHISIQRHRIQYIPRNMHTVFALLCFVMVIHWLFFHIHQAYFTGTVAIYRLPQCQQSNPDEYG